MAEPPLVSVGTSAPTNEDPPQVPGFKPALQKRHTVTLAMSKSSEKLGKIKPAADQNSSAPPKVIVNYGVFSFQGKRDANEDAHLAVPACAPSDKGGSNISSTPGTSPPKAADEAASSATPSSGTLLAPPTAPKKDRKEKRERRSPGRTSPSADPDAKDRKEKKEKKSSSMDSKDQTANKDKDKEKEKRTHKSSSTTRQSADGAARREKKERKEKKEKKPRHREVPPSAPPEKSPITSFFGVYDGHGGKKASDFVSQKLFDYVIAFADTEPNLEQAVLKAFKQTEAEFLETATKENWSDGTTAVIAVIDDKNRLLLANVGDSEALVSRSGKALSYSVPHNPSKSPSERERIVKAGGRLWNDRLGHPAMNPKLFSLGVSRSIGDMLFKNQEFCKAKPSGLIAIPEIQTVQLTSEHEFLLLECDGITDVITHQEAVEFISQKLKEHQGDPQVVAQLLVEEAFRKGSLDNITALLVTFQWPSATPAAQEKEKPK